jgi:hypothetical protein
LPKKGAGGVKVAVAGLVASAPSATVFLSDAGAFLVHRSTATSPGSHSRSIASNSTLFEE